MKIGVFDSGLGGLIITNALAKALPQYDYVYLGDTARVPYGNRSQEAIYHFTQEAVDFLYSRDCSLIITACNTVSVRALLDIRKHDIPNFYPDRDAIGVIRPTADAIVQSGAGKVGIIATASTVSSQAYSKVLKSLRPDIEVLQIATPLLVPLIENDGTRWAKPILRHYLQPLQDANIDTIVLGCTHYPFFKESIHQIMGKHVRVISQDEVMPDKLADYLQKHDRMESTLSRGGSVEYLVTDVNDSFNQIAQHIVGQGVTLKRVRIAKDV